MNKIVKILKKLLIMIIIILLINNFMFLPIVRATDEIEEAATAFLQSFLGLLTLPVRALVLGAARALDLLMASIAYMEGTTDANIDTTTITPFDIFFNKVKILDVNFFKIGRDVNIVNTIRTGIAAWYYALRLIAMSILLVILIYVGIRMAISTVASEKAMYKRMLFDWVVSLVLIFFINYIIIFVITLNNIVVEAIGKNINAEEISDTYSSIMTIGLMVYDVDSIPATIIYCMLIAQTFGLIITYFNRMLKIAFLIIISPLITLTYAVDKMGDGKAQALGEWLKEFIFTVITQIFHCIIYMSMINVAFNILTENSGNSTLVTAVLAILCVNFVKTSENLVRKILMNNHNDSSLSVAGGMAMAAVAVQKSKSLGTTTRKAVNVTRQNLRVAGNVLKKTPHAIKEVAIAPVKGISAIATAVKTESEWKKEKKDKNLGELKKTNKEEYKITKKDHKDKIKARNKQVAEEKRQTKKDNIKKGLNKVKKVPVIKQAVGSVNALGKGVKGIGKGIKTVGNVTHKLNRIASQSDAYQVVSGIAKTYTAVAAGTLTGSLMYGATGDVRQAGMMAVAGYKMHRGFQKSASTMESATQSNLIGAGARTKEDAFKILHDVASNPYLYDGKSQESVKQAELLLKSIGKQLESIVGNPKYKTKIKNEIDRAVKASPDKIPQAIERAFDKIALEEAKKYSDDETNQSELKNSIFGDLRNNQGLKDACNEYSIFANKKQIYSQIEAGQSMGISKDAYVQECTEGFVELDTFNEQVQTLSEKSDKTVEKRIDEMSDKHFEAISDEIIRMHEEISSDTENEENLKDEIKKLERLESTMTSRILADERRALTKSQKKILDNVRKQCGDQIDSLLRKLDIPGKINEIDYFAIANKAGITKQQLDNNIDAIIDQRQKRLEAVKSGDMHEETEAEATEYLARAQMAKQIVQLDQRRSKITERLK